MNRFVALLRGINVGGHRKLGMADLRDLAGGLGYEAVKTYVASGNLVFAAAGEAMDHESALERAIDERFGFAVDVIVRSADQWRLYRDSNPFGKESKATPAFVMLCVGKEAADDEQVAALRAKAAENERVERRGDIIWIWFGNGAGRSKIGNGPAKSVFTTRNWRTVVALDEMLAG